MRNGVSKTTLLGMLAGEADPDVGAIAFCGEAGVLPQTHDTLRTGTTVLDFFRSRVPVYTEDAERLPDAHLFSPDQRTSRRTPCRAATPAADAAQPST